MSTFVIVLLFIIGIVLIVKGGDFFVDAATWIAEVTGIPKFIIGATVVSFATTLPELLVSVFAAVQGKNDMAVGNAVGSVTANIGLIMAVSIIFIPIAVSRAKFSFKAITMIASVVLLWVFCLGGSIGIPGAIVLLCIFAAFIIENIITGKKEMGTAKVNNIPRDKKTVIINILKFVFGAAGIVYGADLLVDYGSEIARMLGVSEAIIGVTVIAIGTSLPELVTTVTSIVKKQANLSIGNIIGANIIDLTLILPVCSLIKGGSMPVAEQSLALDMPFCGLVCVLSMLPVFIISKFKRWQGFALILVYSVYLVLLCTGIYLF